MKRRQWLRWGCAQCALLGAWAHAQTDWSAPSRFTRPDPATDEGGLWAMMDREEARLRRTPFRMREDSLNRLLSNMACKLGGDHCPDIRIYALRVPYFNANMAPNGMMQVWSGLLLRVENEAQLAAVVGHEIGHYLQRHTVERLRDMRARSAFAQFMGVFGLVGVIGQLATLATAFSFSRDQERDADRIGIVLMRQAGYDPREASKVWANLLAELSATPGRDPLLESPLFATHPPSDERRVSLEAMAAGSSGETGEAALRACLAPLRFGLLEDELKRGHLEESIALLNRMIAREADSAELLYFRGEARRQRAAQGDADLALEDLNAAVRSTGEPAATHRSLGELYRTLNQPQAARAAWQRYLERAPEAPDAAIVKQTLEELKP